MGLGFGANKLPKSRNNRHNRSRHNKQRGATRVPCFHISYGSNVDGPSFVCINVYVCTNV